jgi:hypothetical protein
MISLAISETQLHGFGQVGLRLHHAYGEIHLLGY